ELHLVGGVKQLVAGDLDEAKEALESSFKHLKKGENGADYKIKQINSASKQVVSGILYTINADIIVGDDKETKNCDVKIWSQPWLENGIKVTLNCEKEDEVVFKHSA
ncbi:sarcocystatin-A-like, partial [Musca vetustissima]|uniref:sarcocystatin-A-like n=1 Tax=Musca vetustissima TaxID=27455 RepID=UPI002AB63649